MIVSEILEPSELCSRTCTTYNSSQSSEKNCWHCSSHIFLCLYYKGDSTWSIVENNVNTTGIPRLRKLEFSDTVIKYCFIFLPLSVCAGSGKHHRKSKLSLSLFSTAHTWILIFKYCHLFLAQKGSYTPSLQVYLCAHFFRTKSQNSILDADTGLS